MKTVAGIDTVDLKSLAIAAIPEGNTSEKVLVPSLRESASDSDLVKAIKERKSLLTKDERKNLTKKQQRKLRNERRSLLTKGEYRTLKKERAALLKERVREWQKSKA